MPNGNKEEKKTGGVYVPYTKLPLENMVRKLPIHKKVDIDKLVLMKDLMYPGVPDQEWMSHVWRIRERPDPLTQIYRSISYDGMDYWSPKTLKEKILAVKDALLELVTKKQYTLMDLAEDVINKQLHSKPVAEGHQRVFRLTTPEDIAYPNNPLYKNHSGWLDHGIKSNLYKYPIVNGHYQMPPGFENGNPWFATTNADDAMDFAHSSGREVPYAARQPHAVYSMDIPTDIFNDAKKQAEKWPLSWSNQITLDRDWVANNKHLINNISPDQIKAKLVEEIKLKNPRFGSKEILHALAGSTEKHYTKPLRLPHPKVVSVGAKVLSGAANQLFNFLIPSESVAASTRPDTERGFYERVNMMDSEVGKQTAKNLYQTSKSARNNPELARLLTNLGNSEDEKRKQLKQLLYR